MDSSIIKGILIGIGMGLGNFVLALITLRIAAKAKVFTRVVLTTTLSMVVRLALLFLVLYLIMQAGGFNFMAVVVSFISAYLVFMAIEIYYLIRMARPRTLAGKDLT